LVKKDPESKYFYLVSNGEDVTITFTSANVPATPIGDKDRIHVVESGNVLKKLAVPAQQTVECSFTVNRPSKKSHKVLFECVFFTISDPKNAKYKIEVSGTLGGVTNGPFQVPDADRLNPTGEIWFTV
jgi:hypothetical protein